MRFSELKTVFRRLPKNLKSNRLWIIWGGALYVRSGLPHHRVPKIVNESLEIQLSDAKIYLKLCLFFSKDPIPAEVVGVLLTELGKFGNMVRRLANALTLSAHLTLPNVVVPEAVIFHQEIFGKDVYSREGFGKIWFGKQPGRFKNPIHAVVTGDFFRSIDFGPERSLALADLAWQNLRMLSGEVSSSASKGKDWLTVHIRAGDVFGSRKATAYGQPPLSFYQLVLASTAWRGVTLVYQDTSNPVVIELKNYCESLGMTVELQSGTIHDDLQVLLSAKTLVAGRGTFIPGVAGLSSECEKIFYFEDKCNLVPRRSGIELIRVSDKEGTYRESILSNNWNNTPEQRDLMLTYPLSSLVMEGP